MEIIIKKSFPKALKAVPKHTQEAVKEIIIKLSLAKNLELSGIDFKKMEGQRKGENYYRIRVGDWRIGAEYINPKILLITILTRGNIYKQFPQKK
jgi:mRNA interferase RelE/StbE